MLTTERNTSLLLDIAGGANSDIFGIPKIETN
jgi:hypothetical protein